MTIWHYCFCLKGFGNAKANLWNMYLVSATLNFSTGKCVFHNKALIRCLVRQTIRFACSTSNYPALPYRGFCQGCLLYQFKNIPCEKLKRKTWQLRSCDISGIDTWKGACAGLLCTFCVYYFFQVLWALDAHFAVQAELSIVVRWFTRSWENMPKILYGEENEKEIGLPRWHTTLVVPRF